MDKPPTPPPTYHDLGHLALDVGEAAHLPPFADLLRPQHLVHEGPLVLHVLLHFLDGLVVRPDVVAVRGRGGGALGRAVVGGVGHGWGAG